MSNFEDDLLNDDLQWKDAIDEELDTAQEEALLRVSDDEVNLDIGGSDAVVDNDVEYVDEEGNPVDMTENANTELYEVKTFSPAEDDGVLCLTQEDDVLEVDIDGDLDVTQEGENIEDNSYKNTENRTHSNIISVNQAVWQSAQLAKKVSPYNVSLLETSHKPIPEDSVEEQVTGTEQSSFDTTELSVAEDQEKISNLEDESDEEDDDRRERFRSERKSVVLLSQTKRRTDIPDSLESVIPEEESAKVDEFLAKERERKLQRKGLKPRIPFRPGPHSRQTGNCVVPLLPCANANRGEIPVQPVHPTPQQQQQQQQNQSFIHNSNSNAQFKFDDPPEHFSSNTDANNIHGGRKILINPHFRGPRPSVSQGILPHPVNNIPFHEPNYNEPSFGDGPHHLRGMPPDHSANFRDFREGPNNGFLGQRPPLAFRNFNPRFPPPMRERPVLNAFERPSNSGMFQQSPRSMGPPMIQDLQGPRFLNVQRLPPVQQMQGMDIPGNLYTPFDSSPSNKCHPAVSEAWNINLPPNHPPSPHNLQEMPHQHPNSPFQHRPPFASNSNISDHHPNFGGFQPRPPFPNSFNAPGGPTNVPLLRSHLPPDRTPHSEFLPPHSHHPHPGIAGIRPLMDQPPSFNMNLQVSMENKPPLHQQPTFQNFNSSRNQVYNSPQRNLQPKQQQYQMNQQTISPNGQKRVQNNFQGPVPPVKQARLEPRKVQRKVVPNVRKPAVRSSNIKEVPLSESLPASSTSTVTLPQSTAVTPVAEKSENPCNPPVKNEPEKPESSDLPLEEEEEDDETRDLRRKIEQQKKLREEIIRQKEKRRREMAAQRLKDLQERLKEQEENKIPVTVKNCPTPSIQPQKSTPQPKPSVKCRLGYPGQHKLLPSQSAPTPSPLLKKRVVVVRKKVPPVGPVVQQHNQGCHELNQNLISVNPPSIPSHQAKILQSPAHRSVVLPNAPSSTQVKNLQTTKVLEHIKQMSQNRTSAPSTTLLLNRGRQLQVNHPNPKNISKTVIPGNVQKQQMSALQQSSGPRVMQQNVGSGRGIARGITRLAPQKVVRLNPQQATPSKLQYPQLQQQRQTAQQMQASRMANSQTTASTAMPPPRSRRVLVENLAASTSENQLSKLCNSVGPVQAIQMQQAERKAIVTFNNALHAIQFQKKYQRFMLDLSMIQVSLMVT